MPHATHILTNCRLATMVGSHINDLGLIDDAALVWQGQTIQWVGPRSNLPTLESLWHEGTTCPDRR